MANCCLLVLLETLLRSNIMKDSFFFKNKKTREIVRWEFETTWESWKCGFHQWKVQYESVNYYWMAQINLKSYLNVTKYSIDGNTQKICNIEYLWCEEQEKIFLVCLRSGIIWFGLHVHTMSRPPFPSMEYLIHLSKFFHRRKFVLTCFCWAVEIFPSTEYIYIFIHVCVNFPSMETAPC